MICIRIRSLALTTLFWHLGNKMGDYERECFGVFEEVLGFCFHKEKFKSHILVLVPQKGGVEDIRNLGILSSWEFYMNFRLTLLRTG